MDFIQALNKLKNGQVEYDIIKQLLSADQEQAQIMFSEAYKLRQEVFGNKVYLRGLIEYSNYCSNLCAYCGINASVTTQVRYRLTLEEILECADTAHSLGYQTLVLQGGEDPHFTGEKFTQIISAIKAKYPDIAITLSLGVHKRTDYQAWFDAGADRYLMRFESSDAELFAKIRPATNLAARLAALEDLRQIGYQVGTGNMVGMPGQTLDTLVNDILLLYKLRPDMIGIGPFIPHPATPLADYPHGDVFLTLKELAILRIIMPYVNLPATTALGTLEPGGQLKALACGANVIMPNVSPPSLRKLYAIYPDKAGSTEDAGGTHARVLNTIAKAGLEVDFGRGDSRKQEWFAARG